MDAIGRAQGAADEAEAHRRDAARSVALGDLDDAARVLALALALDLPRWRDWTGAADLAGLHTSTRHRLVLDERVRQLQAAYAGAFQGGVPVLEASAPDAEGRSRVVAGVFVPAQSRWFPVTPPVDGALGALVDVGHRRAIVVTGRRRWDDPHAALRIDDAFVVVWSLEEPGVELARASLPGSLVELEVHAAAGPPLEVTQSSSSLGPPFVSWRVAGESAASGWRGLGQNGLRPAAFLPSQSPALLVRPGSTQVRPAVPSAWRVERGSLDTGDGQPPIKLGRGHGTSGRRSIVAAADGSAALVLSLVERCDIGVVRHVVDRVDLHARTAAGVLRDLGPVTAWPGGEGEFWVQSGARTVRVDADQSRIVRTAPLLVPPFVALETCGRPLVLARHLPGPETALDVPPEVVPELPPLPPDTIAVSLDIRSLPANIQHHPYGRTRITAILSGALLPEPLRIVAGVFPGDCAVGACRDLRGDAAGAIVCVDCTSAGGGEVIAFGRRRDEIVALHQSYGDGPETDAPDPPFVEVARAALPPRAQLLAR